MRITTNQLALFGFLSLSPALLFVGTSLLKYGLGIGLPFDILDVLHSNPERKRILDVIESIVFLGGPLVAFGLNGWRIVRLSTSVDTERVVGTLTLERRPWNLAVMALGALLVATLLGYLVVENWRCWAGLQSNC